MDFKVTEITAITEFGKYVLESSSYMTNPARQQEWQVRFQSNAGTRWTDIEQPTAGDDVEADDWPSLDAAKEACVKHHAHLRELAGVVTTAVAG